MQSNGKLSILLRPTENDRGSYFIGTSDFPASVDIDECIIRAFPQENGSLLLVLERNKRQTATISGNKNSVKGQLVPDTENG